MSNVFSLTEGDSLKHILNNYFHEHISNDIEYKKKQSFLFKELNEQENNLDSAKKILSLAVYLENESDIDLGIELKKRYTEEINAVKEIYNKNDALQFIFIMNQAYGIFRKNLLFSQYSLKIAKEWFFDRHSKGDTEFYGPDMSILPSGIEKGNLVYGVYFIRAYAIAKIAHDKFFQLFPKIELQINEQKKRVIAGYLKEFYRDFNTFLSLNQFYPYFIKTYIYDESPQEIIEKIALAGEDFFSKNFNKTKIINCSLPSLYSDLNSLLRAHLLFREYDKRNDLVKKIILRLPKESASFSGSDVESFLIDAKIIAAVGYSVIKKILSPEEYEKIIDL